MTYLDLGVFSTFHTCSVTALEPKLTAVVWRAQKSQSSGAEDRWIFPEAHRALRSFLMAREEFPQNNVQGTSSAAFLRKKNQRPADKIG